MRTVLMLFCFVAATGCGASLAGPDVPLGQSFMLRAGEAAAIAGTSLVIEFTGVTGDSRCPADAICIHGGDALVHIRVSGDGAATYELHTGDSALATVVHRSFRISLDDLQPYPFSSGPIRSNDYRATLTVTRV